MKQLLTIIATITFSHGLFAQTTVENSLTVEEYVNDFLLGEGVDAFNITYNGMAGNTSTVRVGSFASTGSGFPFEEGMLMATKQVGVATCGFETGGSGGGSDPDLFNIVPSSLYDVTVVEFDFIPTGDTVQFNFIFASREYHSFVCSSYNDVFGFFISGPGINGPFSNNAENIALLPDGITPVSINTVNNGSPSGSPCSTGGNTCPCNSAYFIDNGGSSGNNMASDICFGGYTTSLTARSAVICGEVYHMKLAIANVSDGQLDSGVFLEKGSFASSATVSIEATPISSDFEVGENDFTDGILAGCTDARFCLSRADTLGIDTAYFYISGSAIPGEQFVMPEETYVIFPEGVDTICFDIISISNTLGPQVDTLIFSASTIDPCTGDSVFTSASLLVYNEYTFDVFTEDVSYDCPMDMVPISASSSNGVSPYSYVWHHSSDPTTVVGEGPTILVPFPDEGSETYVVVVTDNCLLTPATGTVTVTNNTDPDPMISISPEEAEINCVGESVNISAIGSLGHGELSYSWSNGANTPSITVTPDGSVTENWYYITVTDECGTTAMDSVVVYFIPLDEPIAEAGDDVTVVCAEDEVTLVASASSGATPYTYQWQGFPAGQQINVSPSATQTYYLTVTDNCGGTSQVDSVTVNVPIYDPISVEIPEVYPACPGDVITISANVSGGAGAFDYDWEILYVNDPPNSPNVTFNAVSSANIVVTVTDQCGATGSGNFIMLIEPNETITVTPAIKPACTGNSFTLSVADVQGGAGENSSDYTFVWTGPQVDSSAVSANGTVTVTNANPDDTYLLTAFDECGDFGNAEIKAQLISADFIPNVITPNGDGKNDFFVVPGSSTFSTKVVIMDRWGKVAFESDDYHCDQEKDAPETFSNRNCWDGADKRGEVFYYMIEIDNGLCSFQGTLHVLDGN